MSQSKTTSYHLKKINFLFYICIVFLNIGYTKDIAKIGDKRIITSQEVDSLSRLIATAQGGDPENISKENQSYLNGVIVENLIAEELIKIEVKLTNIKVSAKKIDSAFKSFQEQFGGKSKFNEALKSSNQSLSAFKQKLKQELLSQTLLKKYLSVLEPPSEEIIKSYFKKNKKTFPINDSLRASQIFLNLAKKASNGERTEKQQQLENIRKSIIKITNIEKRLIAFSKIAYEDSEGLYAKKGGDMGFFQKDDFVREFNKNVNTLQVGDVSKVFQTPQGVHLVLLTTKNDGNYKSYRLSIIQSLIEQQTQKNQKKLSDYIRSLAKKHDVIIFDSKYTKPNPASLPFK